MTKNEDLDLALSALLARREAKEAPQDQVEDGEQHCGILRDTVSIRERWFSTPSRLGEMESG